MTEQQAFLPSRSNRFYLGIVGIIILSFATVLLPRDLFIRLSSEDGFFENLGALCFLATAIMFFMLFFQRSRFADEADYTFFSTKGKRYFFLLMGLLFIVLLGEEISWGQRIFGWGGIDGNMQDEFNIHNMSALHHYVEGEDGKEAKTGIAALFTAKKLFMLAFVSFLFLLPLLYHRMTFVKNLVDRFYIPVPVIQLGILFLFNSLIFRGFKYYYGYDKIGRSLSEVEEFNMALILLFLPFVWLGSRRVESKV